MSFNISKLLLCGAIAVYGYSGIAPAAAEGKPRAKCNENVVKRHEANIAKKEALCEAAQAAVKEIEAAIAAKEEGAAGAGTADSDSSSVNSKKRDLSELPIKALNRKLKSSQKRANKKCENIQKAINALNRYKEKMCVSPTPTPSPTPSESPTPEPTSSPAAE